MHQRWMVGMWATAAAAMLGVLVAAATSASTPPVWLLALLVGLPAAITLGVRLLRRSYRSDYIAIPYPERATAVDAPTGSGARPVPAPRASAQAPASAPASVPAPVPAQDPAPVSPRRTGGATEERSPGPVTWDDWEVVSEICCVLGSQQLDWFRSNDFVTPWLDFHARPVMSLEPLVASVVERPFEPDLRNALALLADALHAFVEYYGDNTFPDPLLLGEDWRFFDWDDRGPADESAGAGDLWGGRPARLRELATRLTHAYEGLGVIASRNPNVRQRIEARA